MTPYMNRASRMKPELLSAHEITSALDGGYWRVSVIDETESTQNLLRTSNPKPGDLITTEYQSQGRGRLGRSFSAQKSTALLFSFYLAPKCERNNWGFLPLLVGMSVANSLIKITGDSNFKCKWPNDILFNEKKIAGLLVETFDDGVIVGVGINVSTTQEQLPVAHASSIFLETGKQLNRNILLAEILAGLTPLLVEWETGSNLSSLIAAYSRLSATLGQNVQIELPGGKQLGGIATRIDSSGALVLGSGELVTVGDVVHLTSKLD